ncbi:CPBP family intramembrane glutamic endopeptidase [Aneurinibacillus tyrosinisolvens]|uniref:CPBP family intramembrane glutamic endopeptidase n=1 Tax=Aneurinibacillus tyrosinisolvens TaxID=1443435 RepID=UPI00069C1227|nr:CPBP family intramembrane glutamic endopeptidase [Aneurinibacillus tyrosinisolvens]
MDPRYEKLDARTILLNVYLSQGIILLLGFLGLYFFYIRHGLGWADVFIPDRIMPSLLYGGAAAIVIIMVEVLLIVLLPKNTFDDGGLNELLFRELSFWQIGIVALIVAFSEELLFRAVVQPGIGLWWTSLLFAAIHVRYLRKWVMFFTVFLISLLFGWLFSRTGSIWTIIWAHFLVDFLLGCFLRLGWFVSKEAGISAQESNMEITEKENQGCEKNHE